MKNTVRGSQLLAPIRDQIKQRRCGSCLLALVLVTVLIGLLANTASAALIFSGSNSYLSGDVVIDLNVYDGQAGGRYLWEYTVTNNGYDPTPGSSNGFSGFELYLPTAIPEIADIIPGAPWEINCCSGHPTEWDIPNSNGTGIMPGSSGVFSFTTDPRAVAINNDGWFHSWVDDIQTATTPTPGMYVPWVPGLPTVPEPTTLMLLASGLAGLAVSRRKRR